MRSRQGWLTAAQQAVGITAAWPEQPRPTIRRHTLWWRGCLQPSALSPSYAVSVAYKPGDPPSAHVIEPALDPGHREELPHVYDGARLCLYTPGEWNPTMSLARTILPWIAEWLFHYEVWRTTDRWVGGGNVYAPRDESAKERAMWNQANRGHA